jgi:hypothetical protein
MASGKGYRVRSAAYSAISSLTGAISVMRINESTIAGDLS